MLGQVWLAISVKHIQCIFLKHRWHAWESNPGRQDGRRRRIHWAMAAPQFSALYKKLSLLPDTIFSQWRRRRRREEVWILWNRRWELDWNWKKRERRRRRRRRRRRMEIFLHLFLIDGCWGRANTFAQSKHTPNESKFLFKNVSLARYNEEILTLLSIDKIRP